MHNFQVYDDEGKIAGVLSLNAEVYQDLLMDLPPTTEFTFTDNQRDQRYTFVLIPHLSNARSSRSSVGRMGLSENLKVTNEVRTDGAPT